MINYNDRLEVDINQLKEVMQAFYIVTHIKSTLYDTDFSHIFSYPESHCSFCSTVREKYLHRCIQSDLNAFHECTKLKITYQYYCPMGLYEVVSPLLLNGEVIGYIMFGQMRNKSNLLLTDTLLPKSYPNLSEREMLKGKYLEIEPKSQMEIDAATMMMETCINYILANRIVHIDQANFVKELDRYILDHISEEITVMDLCEYFNMSRSNFYILAKKCLNCGVMHYIQNFRIAKAKELLCDNRLRITSISEMVGFEDYNYFLKVFKKNNGCSCREFRKKHASDAWGGRREDRSPTLAPLFAACTGDSEGSIKSKLHNFQA